ncbi:MAG TPA: cytochrome c oxidase subunit I [Candidatus Saccharimonadales bacterium]|nr:cytochrome c oxidase subunit I [Candidatus Saccharimonadales bacterium]
MTAVGGAIGAQATGRSRTSWNLVAWLTTTDHKKIGILYLVTAFGFFSLAGLMAEGLRAQLAQPAGTVMSQDLYDQLFTIHGTLMLLFFATPVAIGFANYLVPLQIGAADVAFPRLNALSYWLFLFAGLIVVSGFLTASGAASAGWFAEAPLTESAYSAGPGMDLWIVGVALVGIASLIGAVNLIATIYARRAPRMTVFRMPLFTWSVLVTATMILFAFPPLTAALAMLLIDRHLGGAFFVADQGGQPILWQNLFWFFGHPEVYIIILPFFGIMSEIVPVFSRKPLFGYRSMVFALVAIASLSMAVWAHHMFTTGAVDLPFFSFVSFLIAVPTGIKIFNWIATMWRGQLTFPVAMLWCVGLLYVFTIGGISGVMLASPPIDFNANDTFFVVAHFHNVIIGGTVFATFAGIWFWFPKMTGRFLDERLGRIQFVMWVVGFTLTFLPQYQLGAEGMPRRIATYAADTGWGPLNMLSTIGAVLTALGTIPFFLAVFLALRRPATATDDPWEANSLEWATSSPPPEHNFRSLPPIRSIRPVFDARQRRAMADGAEPGPPVPGVPAAQSTAPG